MLDRDVFVRLVASDEEGSKGEERIEVNLFELFDVFRQVLARAKPETFHEVILDRVSVEEKVQDILSLLRRENRSIAFHHLFPEQASRRVIIVTFLAVLELVKGKFIRIFLLAPFETIRISPV
jgi:segregation and condensation protein A